MRVLIDILHPAHVHFFRNLHGRLGAEGIEVVVTARDKEMTIPLLDSHDIPHTMISRRRHGVGGLAMELAGRTARLLAVCRTSRPDLMLGIMGPSIALAGALLRIPAWVFYDTENAWITNWFAYPLANRVYTPECYRGRTRGNQIRYAGYHELAYLHPARFTPDIDVVRRCGIDPSRRYFLVRFVGWQASHDVGERGLALADKKRIVEHLERFGTVYISSEAPLPPELGDRALRCPVQDVHHVMHFASMVVGESATMASEAAVLGTPALYIAHTLRGYTIDEERRYGLVKNCSPRRMDEALATITTWAGDEATDGWARRQREKLLSERIDVTGYLYEQIAGFPGNASCAA
jgi:hypothetical protein